MTESQHQMAIIKWSQQPGIRSKWPELSLLHHIPNGGNRDAVEARHLKLSGVRSGVPDLHLPVARGKYHSLYIELKTDKGRASQEQLWWGEKLQDQGNCWKLCRGWEEATMALEWYLNGADQDDG